MIATPFHVVHENGCLTVPRKSILGFAERVMPERQEGDNREEYARMHMGQTLIQIREKQYHQNILKTAGISRLGMPGTEESRRRSEFFRGPNIIDTCIKALKEIGTGDLFLFQNNNINQIQKITLKKRNVTITPDQNRRDPLGHFGARLADRLMAVQVEVHSRRAAGWRSRRGGWE